MVRRKAARTSARPWLERLEGRQTPATFTVTDPGDGADPNPGDGSAARARWEKEFKLMRDIFPPALCYTKIVPVDEVVTLTLAYREDAQLARLMLYEKENGKLDRLWAEYEYVSQNALLLVDAFEQLWQYAGCGSECV